MMNTSPITALIVGANGNLGRPLVKKLQEVFPNTIATSSSNTKEILHRIMDIDLIVNVANRYYPMPTPSQMLEMKKSIIGLAELIQEASRKTQARVIHFSTYFQYAPENLAPWSDYSDFKNSATSIYKSISSRFGIPTTEIVLYDNFGGERKDKIFDLMLDAAIKQNTFNATFGESQINLTHISDIVEGVVGLAKELVQADLGSSRAYQLKSSNTFSLRELDALISDSLEVATNVNWGALRYRDKEVFKMWDSSEVPSSWVAKKSLVDYILDEKSNSHKRSY